MNPSENIAMKERNYSLKFQPDYEINRKILNRVDCLPTSSSFIPQFARSYTAIAFRKIKS